MFLGPSSHAHCCGVCSDEGKVELAACKHLLCLSCFRQTASVLLKCPVKTCSMSSKDDEESIDDNHNDGGDSEIVVVHGLCSPRIAWQRVLDLRLIDVSKRYDTYLGLFLSTNALLIHVPKTGGTSFEDALFGIRNRSQHAPMHYWKKRIGIKKWSEMFKFAIVRHPFHRLVSGYTYWKNGALEGQQADHPFVHRCRRELDTLTKFVAYLVHVHRNNLWDYRDVQGCDGTCPTQFRPQLWYFSETLNMEGTDDESNDNEDNKLSNVSGESFKNGTSTTPATTGAGIGEMDYIARFEDLQGAYQTITRTLSKRHQASSSSSSSSPSSSSLSLSHLSLTHQVVPSVVTDVKPCTSSRPYSTSPCSVFVCGSDSGSTIAGGGSAGGNGVGIKDNGGCDNRIRPQHGTITDGTSSGGDGSSGASSSSGSSGSSASSSSSSSGSSSSSSSSSGGSSSGNSIANWPTELPHTRASLHPPELPECFLDPAFVVSVLEVYQCDFDAFGYSSYDI